MTIYIVIRVNDAPYVCGTVRTKQEAIELRDSLASKHTHNEYQFFMSWLD